MSEPLVVAVAVAICIALAAALAAVLIAKPPRIRIAAVAAVASAAIAAIAATGLALAAALDIGGEPAARHAVGGARAKAAARAPPKLKSGRERAGGAARGAEVDAAAAEAPADLLRAGLPPDIWYQAFDYEAADKGPPRVTATRPVDGLYFGLSDRDDPARSTLLTPSRMAAAARDTAGRRYAWWVLDCPEARYAVRASRGAAARFSADKLIEQMRPLLRGTPPHKLRLAEYLDMLRAAGLTVVAEPPPGPDTEVRFNLVSMSTAAERQRATDELAALTERDFAALDWSAYDAAVTPCAHGNELGGDVVIDLAARAVSAPKVRSGAQWTVLVHHRSYVTFHTHPSARYRGAQHEPPSRSDIVAVLHAAAHRGLVWHFITAPEGTYIVRPSRALMEHYRAAPDAAIAAAVGAYEAHQCVGDVSACACGVAECARRATEALRDAGYIAYLREAPCLPLAEALDLAPITNMLDRREARADYAAHAALTGEQLLAADWRPALEASGVAVPGLPRAMWLSARLADGTVQPGQGHEFGAPDSIRSYPTQFSGPLMVIIVDDAAFPTHVPSAAIAAATESRAEWAWLVFLSPARVLALHVDAAGAVEICGPRALASAAS